MKKLVLLLLLISHFAIPETTAQAACTSSSFAGSLKVGSSISGGSLVICASASTAKTTSSTKTTTSSSNAKKVTTLIKVARPPPCIIQVPAAAMVYGMSISGCSIVVAPPAKVVAAPSKSTSKTVASTAVSAQSDQAAFTPNQVGISSSASSGAVGQGFWFGAIAGAHSRSGTILGQAAQVQFTPISYDWSSDDGSSGSGTSFAASWSSPGVHSIGLTVSYSVSYSVGAGWVDAGVIPSATATSVSVSAIPVAVATKPNPPLLVSGNCLTRPGAYRC